MPAITPTTLADLPVLADADGRPRPVQSIVTAQASFEGAGFPVNRPFPQPGAELGATDPFLMLDEMGPIEYGPGEAKGAPDHPHRGFETVTYLFDGEMEHRDSTGGGGLLRGGDTQWMTAGAGLVHSETPTPAMLRDGGLMHGIQLWVNLPRTDKLAMPRYQDLTGDRLTLLRTADERALVRLVAGELDGHRGPGSTYTPIVYAHATIKPGGRLALAWPDVYNALVYVVRGSVRVADDSRPINAQQLAVLGREGDTVVVEADEESDVLLLGGRPLREPIAWYGPFVMNTKQEIIDAVDDFEAGRMGSIAPEHA
ncbi:MAG TPA: pirin family protein [Acidimicrobiia bacterium]|jgi:redox-sensitive bicupin YhaK (pirin superfamily)|nr:pirin family protein [Acidimicrobiia bacterium]